MFIDYNVYRNISTCILIRMDIHTYMNHNVSIRIYTCILTAGVYVHANVHMYTRIPMIHTG